MENIPITFTAGDKFCNGWIILKIKKEDLKVITLYLINIYGQAAQIQVSTKVGIINKNEDPGLSKIYLKFTNK
jgi:hypothetical protein